MTLEQVPSLVVAIPLAAAAVLVAVGPRLPRAAGDSFATLVALCVLGLDAWLLFDVRHSRVVTWLGGWRPRGGLPVGINFVADPFAAGAALLVAALVVCALLYGWH